MNQFMLIFRKSMGDSNEKPTAEQMQAMLTSWQKWISGISRQGKYVDTNRLFPEGGKTISPGNVVTDGPYAEGKEMVGGYLVVKSASLNEAVELAKSCPALTYGGIVEVRPVMSIDHNPESATFLSEVAYAS